MGKERLLCGAGAGVGTRLLTRSFPPPHWAGRSELSANSGDPKTGAAKCPHSGEMAERAG